MDKTTSLKGAVLVAQSGGPTAVINASAYGVVKAALASKLVTQVLWAANGVEGILEDRLYDCRKEDAAELALLKQTPAAAMGSCRKKIKEEAELAKIVDVLKKHDVRYFFYNGGNDSMDTCQKIHDFAAKVGYEMRVIGVPKTIDNDLASTDHCPGYGSAAKFVATACMELRTEAGVYGNGPVIVLEVMGRNAGWLTAASALASASGFGPDLIYLPEVAFDMEKFLADVTELNKKKKGQVLIAVSEGIQDASGKYITEYAAEASKDSFGHTQLGGLAAYLASQIKNRLLIKVKAIELSLLQRCGAHAASKTDVEEAYTAGKVAFESAARGESGKMIAYKCTRGPGGYKCEYITVPLNSVANHEKKVPLEWITKEGNNVTNKFIDYALPLIQGDPSIVRENGLPRYARLKRVLQH